MRVYIYDMKLRLSLVPLGLVSAMAVAQTQIPATSYERSLSTLYLSQRNEKYANDGGMYCAPTSAAMEFSWLAQHGYPTLVPKGDTTLEAFHTMVELLGSRDYMDTSVTKGTSTIEAITGVKKYVEAAGYQLQSVDYSGYRSSAKNTPANVVSTTPDFGFLRNQLNEPHTVVMMNVGYYVPGSAQGRIRRTGGHWLAVVGYGTIGDEKVDDSVLLIHNPAHTGYHRTKQNISLPERLQSDVTHLTPVQYVIENSTGREIRDTQGMFTIQGAGLKNTNTQMTLVDGILSFTLAPTG